MPHSGGDVRAQWSRFLADTPVVALAITAAAYLRCIRNEFVYDDNEMIVHNPFLGAWAMVWKSFVSDSWWFLDPHNLPQSAFYRPLQDVWFWLNYHLFGFAVPGWHLALIAVHLIVVWLVFKIAQELTSHRWEPLLAATLFGVMPLHAQAVVRLTAIPLPMSAAFETAAFLCFIRGGMKRRWALILFAFALMSHESSVIFPLLLIAYAVIMQSSPTESIRDALVRVTRETWGFFAILAGYLGLRFWVLGFISEQHFANRMTFAQALMTLPSVVALYLRLLLVPWSAGPEHPIEIVSSMLSPDFYFPLAIAIAVALAAVFVFWKAAPPKLYLFWIAWMAIGLLPVLNLRNFPPWGMAEDRYLYLSSIGWCLMVGEIAVSGFEAAPFARIAAVSGAAALVALYAGILLHIEPFWHDDVRLFSVSAHRFPNSWLSHFQLAKALKERGDLEGAEREYRTALDLEPDYPIALLNFAALLEKTGRIPEALEDLRRAVVFMPQWKFNLRSYINLANNADSLGAIDLRESALEEAANLPGGQIATTKTRAQIDLKHGDLADAESLLLPASREDPGDVEIWALLATAFAREGKRPQAIDACQKALALNPGQGLREVLDKLLSQLRAAWNADSDRAVRDRDREIL